MKNQWDEVTLWALAETLAERMEAINKGGRNAKRKQRELDLGPGGNVVQISDYCRRDCACRVHATGSTTSSGRRRPKARPAPGG